RTAITSPDNVADMLGFPKQNTKESQSIYISNDITEIGKKEAADGSKEVTKREGRYNSC
ncbi:phage portal protein, partial [Bacillus thuringiensis]|nr:phage portal protein [Bacillus thuringiensis]